MLLCQPIRPLEEDGTRMEWSMQVVKFECQPKDGHCPPHAGPVGVVAYCHRGMLSLVASDEPANPLRRSPTQEWIVDAIANVEEHACSK